MDRERVGSTTVAASGWMTGFKLLIAVTVVIGFSHRLRQGRLVVRALRRVRR